MKKLETQKEKVERIAAEQGLTVKEYKQRCNENTARNKGLTPKEYQKQRLIDAAKKKNMTLQEYLRESRDKSAQKKGFREHRDFDKAWKRAKKSNIPFEAYCKYLDKDPNGFYVVPDSQVGRPKKNL